MPEFNDDTQLALDITTLTERISAWSAGRGFWKGSALADYLEQIAATELVALSDKVYTHDIPNVEGLEKHREMARQMVEAAALLRTYELGTKIALIHTELSEMVETLREETAAGVRAGRGNFGEEGADVFIRLADILFGADQDLGKEIFQKQAINDESDLTKAKGRSF